MIKTFGDKLTETVWEGEFVKRIPIKIQQIGRRKLRIINNAYNITDLRIPPATRLEKLKGKISEYYSIRTNNQWRVIFIWRENDAFNVQILDYH